MKLKSKKLYNWSNSKGVFSKIFYPKNKFEMKKLVENLIKQKKKFSIMGNANTYGDSFLNPSGLTISTLGLNKVTKTDKNKNYIEADAGIKMNKLLNILIKKKRIINNIPGSHNVTLGGCIGSNVHGKDSFRFGTFGNNIISIKIIDSKGSMKKISSNSSNFKKYIGSYGTNSIILSAKIKIETIPSSSLIVETIKFNNLSELLNLFENKKKNSYYMGAWINHFSDKSEGIFKSASWNKYNFSYEKIKEEYNLISKFIIYFIYPFIKIFIIKRIFIKYLNSIFFYFVKNKVEHNVNFKNFYFPQEKYMPKHSLFFSKGKISIQILIPKKNFRKHFENITKLCKKFKFESWWMGIKKHKKTKFSHSFNLDGYDITLQWSKEYIEQESFKKFYSKFINYLSLNNIIIYHSKDILLDRKKFLQLTNSKLFNKYFLSANKIFNNFIIKRLS